MVILGPLCLPPNISKGILRWIVSRMPFQRIYLRILSQTPLGIALGKASVICLEMPCLFYNFVRIATLYVRLFNDFRDFMIPLRNFWMDSQRSFRTNSRKKNG